MHHTAQGLAQHHNLGLVALAAIVCICGSIIATLLGRRLLKATGSRRHFQLLMTSTLAGTTIWSTHFMAMLAFEPELDHAFELGKTGLSLGVAITGMFVAYSTLYSRGNYLTYVLGGVFFGFTVAAMHYVGMAAYILPGKLDWNYNMVALSVIAGAVFGAAAFQRIIEPVTKLCWVGAAILMTLAICTMHFTGMAAFEIQPDSAVKVPPQAISDQMLSVVILLVTGVIFLFGFASFRIETALVNDSLSQLKRAALKDALTGLPNRVRLNRKVENLTRDGGNIEDSPLAVLTLDLTHFKRINDLYGHYTGDLVLTAIATRLAVELGPKDFLARTGGDEFVILMRGFETQNQVMSFAEELHRKIITPIEASTVSVTVDAAIGISTSLNDGDLPSDLIHKSGLARYSAKQHPDTHISFYDDDIHKQNRERQSLIDDLKLALDRHEFALVYQLQNNLATLEPCGFEALIRWHHPEKGLVSPAEFIPIAEETGFIQDIGLWVMRTACLEASRWPETISIAVNVAPQQLMQPCFIDLVSDILHETGLSPQRLEIEITEASIIDDHAYTLKVMKKLKAMGVRIAMDDFGTGYSSLATLQAFPFDKIKIDRSFVRNVHQNRQNAAIVRSTLILGDALNIPVLAEGVEDISELEFLRSENCNSVQGFYFGKPMNARDALQLVRPSRLRRAS